MIGCPDNNLERDAGHLMVCHAVKRDDWISKAIIDLASDNRTYSIAEWKKVLKKLDTCKLKVRDWLLIV